MKHQKSFSRRQLLNGGLKAMGGIAVAISGGSVYRAVEEDIFSPFDGPAYEPWTTWKTEALDGVLALLQMGILAASPHNTQPWIFRVTEEKIDVFADRQKHLGSFDPFRREMQIGLGCSIENIHLAALAQGYRTQLDIVSGQLPKTPVTDCFERVATINLMRGAKHDSHLYRAIPNRHTDRGPYDPTCTIPEAIKDVFKNIVSNVELRLDLFESGSPRKTANAIITDATDWIVQDHEMIMDSHKWFRTTDKDIQKFRDGPTLDGAGLSPVVTLLAKLLPDPSPEVGHKMWANATREIHLPSAPTLGFISIKNRYDKLDNLIVGRIWQQLHLLATHHGISMHPMNQPIEWADRLLQQGQENKASKRLNQLIGTSDWQPTFAFRMGYSKNKAPFSPRRPVRDCLIQSETILKTCPSIDKA